MEEKEKPTLNFTGARKRVFLQLLRIADWVPLYELQKPWIGGTSADRRIRELKEMGCNIQWKYKETTDGKKCHTTLYKLEDYPKWFEIDKNGQHILPWATSHPAFPLTREVAEEKTVGQILQRELR